MTSNIKQRRLADRASLLQERAGIPSSRAIQRQIAAANKPDNAPVVAPQPITAAIKGGGAMRQLLEAAETLGHITDQSTIGTDPIVPLSDSASALDDLTKTGIVVRTGPGGYSTRTLIVYPASAGALQVFGGSGDGVRTDITIALSVPLNSIGQLATRGIVAYDSGVTHGRTITGVGGVTVTDGDGFAANPTISLNTLMTAIAALAGTGLVAQTAAGAVVNRSVAAGTGIAVTNGDGVSGNPTVALDLANLPFAFNAAEATASVTASTGATVTYQNALTLTWSSFPSGTWTVLAFGMHRAKRSAAGLINTRVGVAGTNGTNYDSTQDASVFGPAWAFASVAAVSGASVSITLDYKNNSAATATSENPQIVALAIRTA